MGLVVDRFISRMARTSFRLQPTALMATIITAKIAV